MCLEARKSFVETGFFKHRNRICPCEHDSFFQPLDLTVNGQAKKFCKEKFTTWYSQEVQRQLDSETSFEDIEVDLRMSVIKPLHAVWLVALYDYLTGAEGRRCIFKGWEKAGVKEIGRASCRERV